MQDLAAWLRGQGGIAHRETALDAGFSPARLRAAVGPHTGITRVRRVWLALPEAPPAELTAARMGGRIACVSVARRRGWWLTDDAAGRMHLALRPHARSDGLSGFDGVVHWAAPIAPVSAYALEESVEDALAHVASCLPRADALAVWESAVRIEKLHVEALARVRWSTRDAAWCASRVTGLSDSGLETFFTYRLSPWGVLFRQQVVLAGRPVDVLIGERLVVQVDGHRFHSSSADRTRDVAHDAELRLRGYTVLRFTYAQIMHDWPAVARTVARAIAAGAHLAA
ncbi:MULTISPECIES: endonuclease domain-containing protein [Microbacterium]|uniref:DUF559 domain-containing protein n=1 Tax=Microbacterium wangchenii TaxID=2541726 RepID=A0ABX5SP93_9MICO|nr:MULTISPECIES: DUF559 domain-containing protein [Microbacterium]MCK6066626.1 endonuclease domain-containing protein [Microbacterium sp. EYE_512]QBR87960.1 DUF559 domain-containing protein [Microbacterium wangchenii]TXK18250.1 DUF559 domain-containing protein [Microbacterium wangchenii]